MYSKGPFSLEKIIVSVGVDSVCPAKVTLQLSSPTKPDSVKVTSTAVAIARLIQSGTISPKDKIVKMNSVQIFVFIYCSLALYPTISY